MLRVGDKVRVLCNENGHRGCIGFVSLIDNTRPAWPYIVRGQHPDYPSVKFYLGRYAAEELEKVP